MEHGPQKNTLNPAATEEGLPVDEPYAHPSQSEQKCQSDPNFL